MKVFTNNKIIKKVAMVLIIITIFSFCLTKSVKADSESLGGKLLNPIMTLFVSLGDSAMSLLQQIVYDMDESLVNLNTTSHWWSKAIVIGIAVLAVVAAVAATVVTAGAAAGVIATVGAIISGVATTITIVGVAVITFPVTTSLVEGMLPDNFYLPFYSISPEKIFSNEIALLDVDFFNPQETTIIWSDPAIIEKTGKKVEKTNNINKQSIKDNLEKDKNAIIIESTAKELRSTISKWYQILRDIALVALLSILVYIGIRIVISSTSNDKAKYKQFLIDWVVAICLLFMMQYIMSGSNFIVNKITDIASSSVSKGDTTQPEMFVITDKKKVEAAYKILITEPKKNGEISKEEDSAYYNYFRNEDGTKPAGKDAKMLIWPAENWLQQARIKLQLLNKDSKAETHVTIGWKLIYVALVVYTVIFMFTYIKRVIYMAFLTMIAPLVALTYPIDKMNDGKAQAFNAWFKEYIFNLLIQPMHLIIYTVLVGSAMELASKNIIYVIVCLGFMVPAEKLLRKFFGFEKAGTPGIFAGPAGAAAAMGMVHKLFGKPPHGSGDKGGSENGGIEQGRADDKSKIKYTDVDNTALFGANNDAEQTPQRTARADLDRRTEQARQNQMNAQQTPEGAARRDLDRRTEEARQRQQQQMQSQNENNNTRRGNPNSRGQKIKRAIKSGARYYGHGMKERVKKKGLQKLTLGNLARKTAGLTLGGIAATGGVIAGITSGDPSKAIQYATGAAVGGYKFGDAAAKSAIDNVSVGGTFDYMKQNYYGEDEWNEKQIRDNTKAFQKNFENKEYIRNKFNGDKEKMSKFMNEVVPMCQEYGLTDMKDAETVWDMKEDPTVNATDEQILNAALISKSYGKDTNNLGAKESRELDDTLLMKANGNEEIKTNARNLINRASETRYRSTRKKKTQVQNASNNDSNVGEESSPIRTNM